MNATALSQSWEEGSSTALCLMRSALDLLDAVSGPSDVAAHLDLAIHRLERSLGIERCDDDDENAVNDIGY